MFRLGSVGGLCLGCVALREGRCGVWHTRQVDGHLGSAMRWLCAHCPLARGARKLILSVLEAISARGVTSSTERGIQGEELGDKGIVQSSQMVAQASRQFPFTPSSSPNLLPVPPQASPRRTFRSSTLVAFKQNHHSNNVRVLAHPGTCCSTRGAATVSASPILTFCADTDRLVLLPA